MARTRYFSAELFEFLTDLKNNNSREWFLDNKDRYQKAVKEPLLRFIEAFAEPLHDISPNFSADARPTGGSMFRIYRDVRFAKDKSPYKTHAAAQFRHRAGRDAHVPCFYLHLEPGSVSKIIEKPEEWKSILANSALTARHEQAGESLKRAPRGFDPEHPLIAEIKRKDYLCVQHFSQAQVCGEGFIEEFAASCKAAAPFVRFLTEAVGQEF
ncbi:MAG: DUF2461 domain-containing protein [Acidobacteriota bacterium]